MSIELMSDYKRRLMVRRRAWGESRHARGLTTWAHTDLGPRHSAVAACLLDGMSDKEIVRATGFSEKNVQQCSHSLRFHLQCKTTRALIVKLVRMADNGEPLQA